MPVILDTFNVLHTVGVLPPDLAGLDVPGLAMLMLRSRYRHEPATFVCDGLPPVDSNVPSDLPPAGPLALIGDGDAASSSQPDHFFVRYAGRAATADDLIRDLVNASTAPRRLVVVSSDHEVQRYARRRRCAALSSEEFLQHLADDSHAADRSIATPRPQRPLPPLMSREQVEKWMDVFDVDEAAIAGELDRQPPAETSTAPQAQVPTEKDIAPAQPPAGAQAIEQPSPPLPADLIAQAEALWQRTENARSSSPPAAATPTPAPPRDKMQYPNHATQPALQSPTSNSNAPAPPPQEDAEDAISSLDMNAILPADGRTQPLKKRKRQQMDHRQRKSPDGA